MCFLYQKIKSCATFRGVYTENCVNGSVIRHMCIYSAPPYKDPLLLQPSAGFYWARFQRFQQSSTVFPLNTLKIVWEKSVSVAAACLASASINSWC